MVLDSQIITALSLTGTTLDALGGLYLTYDLLDSRYGPLRALTRLVTYSVLCGACFWPLLGLWFGLIGAVALGPLLAFEYVRHAKHGAESRGEALAFQAIRAVVLGIAGWLTIDMRFGVAFGLASALALVALYSRLRTLTDRAAALSSVRGLSLPPPHAARLLGWPALLAVS
jgi:hypothetical protein